MNWTMFVSAVVGNLVAFGLLNLFLLSSGSPWRFGFYRKTPDA